MKSRLLFNRFILCFICFSFGLHCMSAAAWADCSTGSDSANGKPSCFYVPAGQAVIVEPKAFTFPAGDTTPQCELVTNNCAPLANSTTQPDVMVPAGIEAEWQSFIAHHETCAALGPCPSLKVTLSGNPNPVLAGGSTTLSWTITGGVGSVTCTPASTDSPSTWSVSPYVYTSLSSTVPTGTASVTPNPPSGTSSTTYTLSCTDSIGTASDTATITVDQPTTCNPSSVTNGSVGAYPSCAITCNSGYHKNSSGACVGDAYTAGYSASCPTACGTAASTLYPTSCTDNTTGASVAVSYCAGQSESCGATAPCITYAYSDWGSCSATACGTTGTQTRTCDGSDGSTDNPDSDCGGLGLSQSCSAAACTTSGVMWVATIAVNSKTHPSSQAYFCYTSSGTPPTPPSGGWTFQDTFPGGGPYACTCNVTCPTGVPSYSGTCANYDVGWGGKPSGVAMCTNYQELQSNE